MKARIVTTILVLLPAIVLAQVPVDENGNAIGQYQSQADIMQIGDENNALLSQTQLQELVGPVALYPDDLLAIVLPAAAYPLQIVAAARFLEALKTDSSLQPDSDWDDAIVALTNYPEVIDLLNQDLDWTLRLGEAVVAQQADVVKAVESFRDRAYAAGNLKSDSYQTVSQSEGVVTITPVADDVIYVPYYEPASMVRYQSVPVYYYYPQPHPVYYYPYSAGYSFGHGYFWGVTTAFSIGWGADRLHVYHRSYRGHPYYGSSYLSHWYRSPSLYAYNSFYSGNAHGAGRYTSGDHWRARTHQRSYVRRQGYARSGGGRHAETRDVARVAHAEPIRFRNRDTGVTPQGQVAHTQSGGNRGARHNVARASLTGTEQRRQSSGAVSTHRQQPAVRIPGSQRTTSHNLQRQVTHRQEPVVRSGNNRRQAPASQAREHAPQQRPQTESRHREQPSRQQESKGHGSRSSSGHGRTQSRHSSSRSHKR